MRQLLHHRLALPVLLALAVFGLFAAQFGGPAPSFDRYGNKSFPPGGIVFTGASSIAFWDSLEDDMKPLPVLNTAFPGAEYSDMIEYAERLVIAYRPRAVVVYAGDNDLAWPTRKTPESVLNDVREYVDLIHRKLPETWVYVLSIKPSHARWGSWPKMKEADRLIAEYVRTQERTEFIDLASPMFDDRGNLPRDLFVSDGLHPSAKCYALWGSIIKPLLLGRFGETVTAAPAR